MALVWLPFVPRAGSLNDFDWGSDSAWGPLSLSLSLSISRCLSLSLSISLSLHAKLCGEYVSIPAPVSVQLEAGVRHRGGSRTGDNRCSLRVGVSHKDLITQSTLCVVAPHRRQLPCWSITRKDLWQPLFERRLGSSIQLPYRHIAKRRRRRRNITRLRAGLLPPTYKILDQHPWQMLDI